MKNRIGSLWSLIFAVLLVAIGVWAYSTGHIIKLFGFIPLSSTVYFVFAAFLLITGAASFVTAPQKDRDEKQRYQTQISTIAEKQSASKTASTPLTRLSAPCNVTIKHTKGALGLVNRIAVVCNGEAVGEIKNKGSLQFTTAVAENTVTVIRSDTHTTASIDFSARSGAPVNLNVTLDLRNNVALTQV